MLQGGPAPGLVAAALCAGIGLGASPRSLQAGQWHSLPVAGAANGAAPVPALARVLPGWRALHEEALRQRGRWTNLGRAGAALPASPTAAARTVPLPLSPDAWRRLLRRDELPDEQLAAAILADRRASLLYLGLSAYDEPTLEALAAQPAALEEIRARHAEVLAAFGARFRVVDGRVAVPGGKEAEPLWQALVGETPRTPVRFLVALLASKGGRRAFLFDSVARLDPVRQRFALGLQHAAIPERTAAWRVLTAVFDHETAWWPWEKGTYSRPKVDAARLLRDLRLDDDGILAPPSARGFWTAVFLDTVPGGPSPIGAAAPADAAWLAERIATGDASRRRLRLGQLAFAQRTLGDAGGERRRDVLVAVRGLRDARALILALERMGIRDPALYARGVRAARRAGAAHGADAIRVQRGIQGALAVIDRARFARTLDADGCAGLLGSLFAVPFEERDLWPPALVSWTVGDLLPQLVRGIYGNRAAGDVDTVLLRAMAGDTIDDESQLEPFEWEGLWYRADLGRAEFTRLERVRARQGGTRLAEALETCRTADARNCGDAVGAALTSLVYATHLGDPNGPALAGEDPSIRHDFGPDPWELPEEVSGLRVPWHLRGSLLGLERALARLSLHRLDGDALPEEPPVLDPLHRRALAAPAGLANPRDLTDAGRDAVAAAIDAGRRRVAGLRPGTSGIEAACRDAGLDPWRARAFEWLLEHEADARETFFSLRELFDLGGGSREALDGWGTVDEIGVGLRPRLPPPVPLDETAGRVPQPAVAEHFVDLQLRVVVHLSERRLPASLAPAVMEALLPDLLAEARPLGPDDRLGLEAWVRALPRERLDDAVAALAGTGPLQPAPERAP